MIMYIIRLCMLLLGTLIITLSFPSLTFISFNFFNLFPTIVGAVLILTALFYSKILAFTQIGVLKAIRIIYFIGLSTFFLGFFIFVAFSAKAVNNNYEKADAVIVLGAAIRGTSPSATLANRLYLAKNYYNANKDAVIVVSGGQGADEIVTEASVMKQYLIDNGVPSDKILVEDRSTSTKQNFIYSKEVLDNYFNRENYTIVFATDNFHVLRCNLLAKKAGFTDINSISYKEPKSMFFIYYFREFIAFTHYLVANI